MSVCTQQIHTGTSQALFKSQQFHTKEKKANTLSKVLKIETEAIK